MDNLWEEKEKYYNDHIFMPWLSWNIFAFFNESICLKIVSAVVYPIGCLHRNPSINLVFIRSWARGLLVLIVRKFLVPF
jgi:hypothetical protein